MDLTQYFFRVLRWWWLILLSTGIAAVASYFASLQQPNVYQTTTTLMVGQVIQEANPTGTDFLIIERLAESYAQMATRQPILKGAVDNLGLDMPWQALGKNVYAAPVPRTQLLAIAVQNTDPKAAMAFANEIAHQLIRQSPASPDNKLRQERSLFVQEQLDDLETRIEGAQSRVKELEAELDTAFSARQIQGLQTEISTLNTLVNNWQANYSNLLSFLEGGNAPNYLTVIEPAQLPTVPVSPNIALNVLLAAVVGFTLALGAALLLEYIDDTIKATEDLDQTLGLTTLGSVMPIKGKDYNDKLIINQGLFSPVAEAYRLVRTNIQFMAVDHSIKSIMITSTKPGEGKSITAANLGIIFAQANLNTIIIDTDLRRPKMHKIFKVSNSSGFTDLLRSPELDINRYIKSTDIKNLQVITSGPLPPNPAEMLGSQRMAELLNNLKESADMIIFDSPPVLAVTDSTVLAGQIDGVVLVIQEKQTRRGAVQETIKRLQHKETHLLGALLNQVSGKSKGSHYYSQYYSYSQNSPNDETTQGTKKRRWWQRQRRSLVKTSKQS